MYIEASEPRRENDQAILISPQLAPTAHCFTVYYHMSGAQTGFLKVNQVYPSPIGLAKVELFSKQGILIKYY